MLRYIRPFLVIILLNVSVFANTTPHTTPPCNDTLYGWAIQSHREFWTLLGKMAGYESRNEATYQYVKSPQKYGLNYVYIDKTNTDPDYVFRIMKGRVASFFFQSDNDDMMFRYITVLNPSSDHVAMALNLNELKAPSMPPKNIKVWPVKTDAEFEVWLKTTISRRSPSEAPQIREYFEAFKPSKDKNKLVHFYLGSVDGKIVGTSIAYHAQNFVSLYWVGVHPDYRRKGLGSALSYVPLQDAKSKGYEWSILQAQPLGAKVYPNLGFKKVGIIKVFYHISP